MGQAPVKISDLGQLQVLEVTRHVCLKAQEQNTLCLGSLFVNPGRLYAGYIGVILGRS